MLKFLTRFFAQQPSASPSSTKKVEAPVISAPTAVTTAQQIDESVGISAETVRLQFHQWLLDSANAPTQPAPNDALSEASKQLEQASKTFDIAKLPRLPALVPQLMAAMRRSDADAAEIANLLARDPMLAGEVLRVANSAWYQRGGNTVTSLLQAVKTMGYDGLRHVILSTVMRPILRAEPDHPNFAVSERLWAYIEACTWLCGQLAPGRCDTSEAQLVGVIASTGASALLRTVSIPALAHACTADGFSQVFTSTTRQLSSHAAAYWQLPESLQATLLSANSKQPNATAEVLMAAELLAMAAVLEQAGLLDRTQAASIMTSIPNTSADRLKLLTQLQESTQKTAT